MRFITRILMSREDSLREMEKWAAGQAAHIEKVSKMGGKFARRADDMRRDLALAIKNAEVEIAKMPTADEMAARFAAEKADAEKRRMEYYSVEAIEARKQAEMEKWQHAVDEARAMIAAGDEVPHGTCVIIATTGNGTPDDLKEVIEASYKKPRTPGSFDGATGWMDWN
jgi:hypothetical protein